MTINEKRREVAQELRALDVSDIEVDGRIIDSPKYVVLLLMRMLDAACDYRDGLHYFPGFFSARAVVELFADLIDPTCHLVGTTSEDGLYGPTIFSHELSCGHACDTAWSEPPAYCYECGARVVRTSD